MTNYQNKRKQQQIKYQLTMLSDTRKSLKKELEQIEASISLLQEQRLELNTGGITR